MLRSSTITEFFTVVVLTQACSSESLKRFGYAVGAQQACMAGNEDHVLESVEDLECTSLLGAGDLSYDEYAAARTDTLAEQTTGSAANE